MAKKQIKPAADGIERLLPDPRNANRGTDRGRELVRASLERCGAGRSVVTDKHLRVIGGNKTVEAAKAAGITKIRIVQTDGKELVVVQRSDLDLGKDSVAQELAVFDNRTGELGLQWDPKVLQDMADDGHNLEAMGFSEQEMQAIANRMSDADTEGSGSGEGKGVRVGSVCEVCVVCKDEADQKKFFDRMVKEGRECRVLTI